MWNQGEASNTERDSETTSLTDHTKATFLMPSLLDANGSSQGTNHLAPLLRQVKYPNSAVPNVST
jgi:hypothetical protein